MTHLGQGGDPWEIKEALKAYTRHLNEEDRKLWPGAAHITPSKLAGDLGGCARYLGYVAIGEPKEHVHVPTGMYLFATIGKAVHKFFQDALAFYHRDKAEFEVNAYDGEIYLKGKADGELKDGVIILGLEIKTVGTRELERIKKGGHPRRKDEAQTQHYFALRGWTKCVYVYVDRQGLKPTDWVSMEIIIAGPNKPMYTNVRNFILEDVFQVMDRGEIPLPSRGPNCAKCPFRTACSEDRFGE